MFSKAVVLVTSKAEFDEILGRYREWRKQFLDDSGELKPRFKPAPLHSSFMDGDSEQGPKIAVPKGPVETW
jgi:hypothetical protein